MQGFKKRYFSCIVFLSAFGVLPSQNSRCEGVLAKMISANRSTSCLSPAKDESSCVPAVPSFLLPATATKQLFESHLCSLRNNFCSSGKLTLNRFAPVL